MNTLTLKSACIATATTLFHLLKQTARIKGPDPQQDTHQVVQTWRMPWYEQFTPVERENDDLNSHCRSEDFGGS